MKNKNIVAEGGFGKSWNRVLTSCFFGVLAACNDQTESMSQPRDAQTEGVETAVLVVTPLLTAVGAADVVVVQRLLESGADPDDPTASRSPLVQAITSLRTGDQPALVCNVSIVQELLKHGANPNRADPGIAALPLQAAFDVGSIECIRLLLDAGARADLPEPDGRTALIAAVGAASRLGDMSLLDEALRLEVDINERTKNGWTALHEAVRVNSISVVNYLLAKGADVCVLNDIEQTPLQMAINLERDRLLVEALRGGADCH